MNSKGWPQTVMGLRPTLFCLEYLLRGCFYLPLSARRREKGLPPPLFNPGFPDGARIPVKNIAITAAAKLASLKQAAAEVPRWQHLSRLAPTGMGELV